MAEKIIETLGGGLSTRRHPGLLDEGSLTVARDTEYRPDDPSPKVAAGRASCGVSPTTNPALAQPISALVSVAWPPGTKADADDSEENLKQFLYFRRGAPNGTALLSASVSDDPKDEQFDSERAYPLYGSGAIPTAAPSGYMDAAVMAGEVFLFNGSQNYALQRESGTNQKLSYHGVKRNDVPLWTYLESGPGSAGAAAGYVNYWFTWVDGGVSPEREGTLLAPELNTTGYNSATGGETWVRITDAIAAGNSRITLTANKDEFNAAKPANATGIYIYRTKAYDADRANSVSAAPLDLAWPQGWRITDSLARTLIPISALTETTGPDGSVHYHLCYDTWVITDAALNLTPLVAPIFESLPINDVPDGLFGAPPVSTTGDAFEESIICNDIEDATLVRFSYPGLPHAFPSLFYLRFSPPEGDEVIAIRTLGTRVFVGMRENIFRINWLPRESETDFSRGRVVDRVARRGTFGPQAVCLFEMPGIGPLLAYVSRNGVYMTDLDENRKMTGALDWEAMVPNPQSCLLRNDIDNERLVMAYDSGAGIRDALLYINYSEGKIRITGPIRRPGGIAAICEASTNGGSRIIASTDLSGTRLFYENLGTSDESDGTAMEMLVRTREIYPLALGEEATLGRIFAHGDGDGILSITAFGLGNGKTLSARTKTGAVNLEPLLSGQKLGLCERVAFEITATQTVRVNAAGVFWDSLGEVER